MITAPSELRKVLFLAPLVYGFLFVYEISREPLNGFARNSQRKRVWSIARTCLKVNVKGKGHRGQKAFFGPFGVRFMFGETYLTSSLRLIRTGSAHVTP